MNAGDARAYAGLGYCQICFVISRHGAAGKVSVEDTKRSTIACNTLIVVFA